MKFVVLVLFLRKLATNEVQLRSNAVIVLFLRSLAINKVLLRSNAMRERAKHINILIYGLEIDKGNRRLQLCRVFFGTYKRRPTLAILIRPSWKCCDKNPWHMYMTNYKAES